MRKFLNMHDEYDKLTTLFALSYCYSSCTIQTSMNESLCLYFKKNKRKTRKEHGLSYMSMTMTVLAVELLYAIYSPSFKDSTLTRSYILKSK